MVSGPYVETYSLELVADSIALFVTLTSGECRGRRVSTLSIISILSTLSIISTYLGSVITGSW